MNKRIALLLAIAVAATFIIGCDPKPEAGTGGTSKTMKPAPKNKKMGPGFTDTE